MLLTLVGALFEAAGIGLIVPFVAIITSDNFQLPISFVNTFPFLGALSSEEFILLAIASFIAFYLIKSVFLLFLESTIYLLYNYKIFIILQPLFQI